MDDADGSRKAAIEVQRSLWGKSNRVLSQATVREMLTPLASATSPSASPSTKQGQGWYFGHGGSNWGFQCDRRSHMAQGLRRRHHEQRRQRWRGVAELRARVAAGTTGTLWIKQSRDSPCNGRGSIVPSGNPRAGRRDPLDIGSDLADHSGPVGVMPVVPFLRRLT